MNSACNVRLCFSNDPWWCVPQKLVEFGSIVIFRQLVARNRFVCRFENYRDVTCALLRPRSPGETTTETLSPECGNYDRVFNRSLSLTLNVYLGPPVAAPPRVRDVRSPEKSRPFCIEVVVLAYVRYLSTTESAARGRVTPSWKSDRAPYSISARRPSNSPLIGRRSETDVPARPRASSEYLNERFEYEFLLGIFSWSVFAYYVPNEAYGIVLTTTSLFFYPIGTIGITGFPIIPHRSATLTENFEKPPGNVCPTYRVMGRNGFRFSNGTHK